MRPLASASQVRLTTSLVARLGASLVARLGHRPMAPNISRDRPANMNIRYGGLSLQPRSGHTVALKPNH